MNVDVKITSKVLGKGLEKALSNLIRSNRKAFVNGRSIFDPIRTIDDIVDYTKRNNCSGIPIAIGFEKPFDTLDKTVVYELEKKKIRLYLCLISYTNLFRILESFGRNHTFRR